MNDEATQIVQQLRDPGTYMVATKSQVADLIESLSRDLAAAQAVISAVRGWCLQPVGHHNVFDVMELVAETAPTAAFDAALAQAKAAALDWAAEQCRDGYGPIAAYDAIMVRAAEYRAKGDGR